jgi:DNA mismatch repair protein MutL
MGIEMLPPEVVGKIAAGEVVERPASVVKELVENSLDAGARTVQVELIAGGCDLIRVADDGCGMPRNELLLALERHATSKLRFAEELSHIATLGFRGEALASIAAVSELTIASRQPENASGYQLRCDYGTPGPVQAVPRSPGTTITVEKLFANVPARRKFLKSVTAESGQVVHLVTQLALAYPEASLTLLIDGRRSIATTGSGELLDAAVAVLGRDVAGALLPLEGMVLADRPVSSVAARITGYAAEPMVSKGSRNAVWLFVNRRPIRSRSLSHAVEDGYETLLQVGRFPIAVINLEVPSPEVDVNVHPTKSEVRLLRERLIYGGLRDTVRSAVAASSGWAKELSTLGRNAPSSTFADADAQARLLDAPISAPAAGEEVIVGGRRLPILRVIGQVAQTYIIAEGEGGLYLIDQHAAHERVLLERLTRSIGREGNTQLMLEPLAIDVGPAEREIVASASSTLEALGYRIEPFGDESILIRGIPTELPEGRAVEALQQALADLAEEKPEADWREKLAISLSCRGAVKAGQLLAPEEMRSLVLALEEMDVTQHCSHGRPTAILLSRTQMEREFGRR